MTIERDYGTGAAVPVQFFFGHEVEKTPAHGMLTLFVVGVQSVDSIIQIAKRANPMPQHVYVGANMSLHGIANDDRANWDDWDHMITSLLASDMFKYVTVDFTASQVLGFLDCAASEDNRVIPMISVKLPHTQLLNYNTTIKIDDVNIDHSNPGVWCHSLHTLMDRDAFTPWHAYQGDNPVIQIKETT